LLLFYYALQNTGSLAHARSVALTTMVLFQVFQAGNARSETLSVFKLNPISNPFLFVATAAALAAHVGALYFGWTQFLLRVEPIPLEQWPRMGVVAASIVLAIEAHKWLRRRAR
jgi:Ca2+-transporting ATPase